MKGQFQSHAGSIEALRDLDRAFGSEARFNPTLVRLRLSYIIVHKVQQEMFQSHAGSIEARTKGALLVRGDDVVSIPRWFD